jgi:hypothetical protein
MNPHNRHIVLAIDDSPERYETLSARLNKHGLVLMCAQHPISVRMVVESGQVLVALLDHDMPTYEYDDAENDLKVHQSYNGQYFAHWLGEVKEELTIPELILISSANTAGAKAIAEILRQSHISHKIMSVLESCPEERWLGAILDAYYGQRK